jgi:hypothetical protein
LGNAADYNRLVHSLGVLHLMQQAPGDGGADVGNFLLAGDVSNKARGREDCCNDRFCFILALRLCLSSTLDYFWPTTTAMG